MRSDPESINAILFDFDGVVLDTRAAIEESWRSGAKAFGRTISAEEFDRHILGRSARDTLRGLFSDLTAEEQRELKAIVGAVEEKTPCPEIPGARKFLSNLFNYGIAVGLVTGSWSRKLDFMLRHAEIRNSFFPIITRDDATKGKPNAEPYLFAKSKLLTTGLIPDSVLVFEDSIAGVEAARAADCIAVGVSHANNGIEKDLLKHGATAVIKDFTSVRLKELSPSVRNEATFRLEIDGLPWSPSIDAFILPKPPTLVDKNQGINV